MLEIPIAKARRQLTNIDELLHENKCISVTRHNKPAFVLVDRDYLESILDTIEVLSDPKCMRKWAEARRDIELRFLHDHEDVKKFFKI